MPALTALLLLLLAAPGAASKAKSTLGPGKGPWMQDAPEHHGLSDAALQKAAKYIAAQATERYCVTVVKDGVIVHETYFHNTSDSVYETDSLGKSTTAALIGIPVLQKILDIDRPIKSYGVQPQAVWNASGPDYFNNVTMRHLLAQSSGYGTVPPGSKMTYDSDKFIQHISYTLTAIAKKQGMKGALEYATKMLAEPLGIPDLFKFDALAPEFSAGGGQMMSCREVARVGQLILNKGKWLNDKGTAFQMADEHYTEQITKPSFPGVIDGYGLLTWLNTDMSKPADAKGTPRSHCCAPRWANGQGTHPAGTHYTTCCKATPGYNASSIPCDMNLPVLPERPCSDAPTPECIKERDPSEYVMKQNLGDSFPDTDKLDQPENIGFGMGQFAKYMYIDPTQNLVVTTFGQSVGQSLGCEGGYDDGYTLSLIWRAIANALKVKPSAVEKEAAKRAMPQPIIAPHKGSARAAGDRTRATLGQLDEEHAAAQRPAVYFAGSCSCVCPPGQGFGKCFNVPEGQVIFKPKDQAPCPSKLVKTFRPAYDFCPAVGYPVQCLPAQAGTNVCTGSQVFVRNCEFVDGSTTFATASCRDAIPAAWSSPWGGQSCSWSDTVCQPTPFFPPPYDM